MALVRQYDRAVRLKILTAGGAGFIVNPLPPTPSPSSPKQLGISFTVQRGLDLNPARASIQVLNMGSKSSVLEVAASQFRDRLSLNQSADVGQLLNRFGFGAAPQATTVTINNQISIKLEAGYGGALGEIFDGVMSSLRTVWNGTDKITTIDAGDGELQNNAAFVNRSFVEGASLRDYVTYIVQELGMQPAPTSEFNSLAAYKDPGGYYAHGYARDALAEVMFGLQLEYDYWIDNNKFWVVGKGLPRAIPPLIVSTVPTEGALRLLHEPEGLEGGRVRLRGLLANGVEIGQPVTVVSRKLAGTYRCEVIRHTGSNRGGPFFTDLVLQQPGVT